MRTYTVPVLTPAALEARVDLAVVADNQPFDLTGASVSLEIWDTRSDDQLVYSASEADPVINVSDIIVVDIPADTAVYSDLVPGYKYRYGLTIIHPELSFVVQGDWQKLKTYGPVSDSANSWTVSTTDTTVTINGGTGPKGDQGDIGPAGPWQAVSRIVTASTTILPTDTLLFVTAGGGSVEIATPDPADIWDGTNGRVITIARTFDDTGTVTVTGDADGLPMELFSGPDGAESVYVTTTDGVSLIVSDAPFVIYIT